MRFLVLAVAVLSCMACVSTSKSLKPPPPPVNSEAMTSRYSPSARALHTSIWTEHGMIVWGGMLDYSETVMPTGGGIYIPSKNVWRRIPKPNLDATSRFHHSSTWTGEELIVWGGRNGNTDKVTSSGMAYNVSLDSWRTITNENAPKARQGQSTIWTSKEMIVFGGENDRREFGDIYAYNPEKDNWETMEAPRYSSKRAYHTAVWTGTEMLVFGGMNASGLVEDGFSFDPETQVSSLLPKPKNLNSRIGHTAVWTGSEMIIFGGSDGDGKYYSDGAAYNPEAKTWRIISRIKRPSKRELHTAIWNGSRMIVVGGTAGKGSKISGGLYDPVSDRWTRFKNRRLGRSSHTAVWSGSEMIVWGGRRNSKKFIQGSKKGLMMTTNRSKKRDLNPLEEIEDDDQLALQK